MAAVTRREALALAGMIGSALAAAGCAGGAEGEGAGASDEPRGGVASIEPIEDTSSWDSAYYVPRCASIEEARLAGERVAERLADGGVVLLKNSGILPLALGTAVSLVGRGAADTAWGFAPWRAFSRARQTPRGAPATSGPRTSPPRRASPTLATTRTRT